MASQIRIAARMLIRKALLFVAYLTGLYLVGWTVAYIFAMGADFRYYFVYLYYVWTNNAGEIPSIINVLACIIAFILLLCTPIVWLLVRRTEIHTDHN